MMRSVPDVLAALDRRCETYRDLARRARRAADDRRHADEAETQRAAAREYEARADALDALRDDITRAEPAAEGPCSHT